MFIEALLRVLFELHRLVDAIQMSTHNKCFYKENQKKKIKHHQIGPLLIFLKYTLSRKMNILPQVLPVISKKLSAQCGNYSILNEDSYLQYLLWTLNLIIRGSFFLDFT